MSYNDIFIILILIFIINFTIIYSSLYKLIKICNKKNNKEKYNKKINADKHIVVVNNDIAFDLKSIIQLKKGINRNGSPCIKIIYDIKDPDIIDSDIIYENDKYTLEEKREYIDNLFDLLLKWYISYMKYLDSIETSNKIDIYKVSNSVYSNNINYNKYGSLEVKIY